MAILSEGRIAWLFRLVLAPLACASTVAFLSSGGGYASVSGLPASAAMPLNAHFQARVNLLASCRRGLEGALAEHAREVQRALEAVNDFFNRVPVSARLAAPLADARWATPEEFLSGKGGLAADFVIAKYFALRDIGIPASRLRVFVAGRKGLSQPHFVLAYYPAPDAQPLILDNFDPAVRNAAARTDLVPVYSFDPDAGAAKGGHRKWREMASRMKG